jgi:hypothetical protein
MKRLLIVFFQLILLTTSYGGNIDSIPVELSFKIYDKHTKRIEAIEFDTNNIELSYSIHKDILFCHISMKKIHSNIRTVIKTNDTLYMMRGARIVSIKKYNKEFIQNIFIPFENIDNVTFFMIIYQERIYILKRKMTDKIAFELIFYHNGQKKNRKKNIIIKDERKYF